MTIDAALQLLDAYADLRRAARTFELIGHDDMAEDTRRMAECVMVVAEAAKQRAKRAA